MKYNNNIITGNTSSEQETEDTKSVTPSALFPDPSFYISPSHPIRIILNPLFIIHLLFLKSLSLLYVSPNGMLSFVHLRSL